MQWRDRRATLAHAREPASNTGHNTAAQCNDSIQDDCSSTHMVLSFPGTCTDTIKIEYRLSRSARCVTSRPLSFLGRLLALAALFTRLFRLVLLPSIVFLHSGVDDLELALDPGRSAHPLAGAALGHHIRQLFFLRLQQSSSAVHSTNSDVIATTLPTLAL